MSTTQSIPEHYIQKKALSYLAHYYRNCSHNNKIEGHLEVYTKAGKRADGVLIWEHSPNNVRVVSIEAKSSNTIRNLLTRWDKEKVLKGGFYVALGIVLILFSLVYTIFEIRIPFDVTALMATFGLLIPAWWLTQHLLQRFFPRFFRTAGVLTQVARYPGNEIWIAIGSDTFKRNKEERLKNLIDQCELRKFGLLEIHAGNQEPVILVSPRFNRPNKIQDFLCYYKKESEIRQQIAGETERFWRWLNLSKAELHYELMHQKLGLLTCLLIGLLSFYSFQNTRLSNHSSQTIISDNNQQSTPPLNPIQPDVPKEKVIEWEEDVVKLEETESFNSFNCSLPFKYKGEKKRWILKDRLVDTEQEAIIRVNTLLDAGLRQADYFWVPCSDYSPSVEAWCVFAYPDRGDKSSILKNQPRYEYILRVAAVDYSEVDVWEVKRR